MVKSQNGNGENLESNMKHNHIQYIEFLSNDLERIKKFYTDTFGWKFTDYGPEYSAFSGEHVDGGFGKGKQSQEVYL